MNAPFPQPEDAPVPEETARAPRGRGQRQQQRDQAPRAPKRDIDGWVLLDKPSGMTSTQAVAVVKRLFSAKKAGHAGTLDPLASGCLPIALGEATKTVPYIMDGQKTYRFAVTFGVETDTDDSEGKSVAESDHRPSDADIVAALAGFHGEIMQVPPAYSALKIAGERAYDLARGGAEVVLEARPITIHRLELVERPDIDTAVLEAECGKGTYVRAIARDLGRLLGTRGHVSMLRRACVGPFLEEDLVPLDELKARAEASEADLKEALDPVGSALEEIPQLNVTPSDAHRLRCGQSIILRGRDAPVLDGHVAISCQDTLIAIGDAHGGEVLPHRVFNWARQNRPDRPRGPASRDTRPREPEPREEVHAPYYEDQD
ncbi:tRNA pseudouridine synthase B [Azorhizobium oxalatiphilum]|uniref:tRNA pseudouridine synthase B n=1 Tax=Azorhizobium oxalatiphilum TaxID=980631 RepID=A0A917CA16_9HYPH|nr:tRNA pseudouridine(55) synthase TruB [Azorhizobium oxalatiphilum]GGF79883.1 tRNA pseudouridine synthase B [Azorhizobium oxalatiphilum]